MRIGFFGQKRVPSREGGVEIVVEELAARMAAKGHEVTCYNRRQKGQGKTKDGIYKGIRIKSVPTIDRRGLAAVTASFCATLCAAFGRYDAVHIHAEGPAFMCMLPKLTGKRVIVTIHGLDHRRAKWGRLASAFIMMGERNAARFADEIIVLSRGVQQYFKDTYGRETHFIPNGVNRPQNVEASLIHDKFGLEKDSYILYLGRLVPEKGVQHLIQAYKRVEEADRRENQTDGSGVERRESQTDESGAEKRESQTDGSGAERRVSRKLVVAGGSADADEFARGLHKAAEGDENIVFTGFVQGRMMEELYSNAYIYVLPSELEGMPLSLMEAMSYGNCCLTSDIAENTDVTGEHGVSFVTNDEDDLTAVLQRLLDNPDEVARYKATAADYICERYSWDDVVEQTLQLYCGRK